MAVRQLEIRRRLWLDSFHIAQRPVLP
jgi:hypothetical protein